MKIQARFRICRQSGSLWTADGEHRLRVRVATGFFSRLRGLMLAPPLPVDEALLLPRCHSVHTCFMRQTIDLLYLDANGYVTKCVSGLAPWRVSNGRYRQAAHPLSTKTVHVLEMAEGSIVDLKLLVGSKLEHPFFSDSVTEGTKIGTAALTTKKRISRCTSSHRFLASHASRNPALLHQTSPHLAVVSKQVSIPPKMSKSAKGKVPSPVVWALPPSPVAIEERVAPTAPLMQAPSASRQRGSAMLEFAVVGPLLTLIGLSTLQYGLLFFAKNQYNHAAFMAARAGSTHNASMASIQDAYARALVPLYGGGTTTAQLGMAYTKAKADLSLNSRVEMLNPTVQSFADFNDTALQQALGLSGKRVIPNGGQSYKKPAIVQANSGQNIQDANVLKLRITHAYKPQVPIVGAIYAQYLKWMDPGTDSYRTQAIKQGLIPVVNTVTLHMQSDAIEDQPVSIPGPGNGGSAVNPGNANTPSASSSAPPFCASMLCTGSNPSSSGSGGAYSGNGAGGGSVGSGGGSSGNGGGSSGGSSGGGPQTPSTGNPTLPGSANPPSTGGGSTPGTCSQPLNAASQST